MTGCRWFVCVLGLSVLFRMNTCPASEGASGYDPLRVVSSARSSPLDLSVTDAARSREIPIRVYLPVAGGRAPVVLFSHGLGGNREGSAFLGEHWSARGYVAVFLQHPGSDDSVWKDVPALQRMSRMRQAANAQNSLLRFRDVPAVLDQLQVSNGETGHALASRLDLEHVGMTGHSFGAVTTQAVSGQRTPQGRALFTDPRIDAAIVFSPSASRQGSDPQAAFGQVTIPWLLMTGTHDTSGIGDQTVESRLQVYPALPAGGKYELVLDHAEHSAFTDRPLPGDSENRNPNHHRSILAISTAFLDAYLRDDAAAQAWLDGEGPRSVLEPADRWQRK